MADIFISYAHVDRARCDAVYEVLTKEGGYKVAVDHQTLETGDSYRARIEREIDAATVVVALFSSASTKRDFMLDELDRAKRHEKVLLPLIIDDMSDGEVLGYGQLQALHCKWLGERLDPESRARLLADVERHIRPVGPRGATVLETALKQLRDEVDRKLGDEYTVEKRIGTGRLTVVFQAQHNVLERKVALKVVPLAGILLVPGFYTEFRGALEASRSLSHESILPIHDVMLFDTIACAVFDFVDGESLEQRIAKAGAKMPLYSVKDWACEIADALAYAHSNNIVHGRLMPSNVLIAASNDRAFVTDFGTPNVGTSPEAIAAKALLLNASYLSPEQCLDDAPSAKSDQYALGATLYEMLTGRPPFLGKSIFAIMKQHCEATPAPITDFRPDCPPAIEATVLRLLSKQPNQRFFTTRELLNELRAWPLPDPASQRDRISTSGVEVRAAKTALASFERILSAEPLLLTRFYRRLCEDPSFARLFGGTNFDRQVEMLRKGVRHILEYSYLGNDTIRIELERVAAVHRQFNLEVDQLRRFIEILVDLVLELDPHAADSNEKVLLRSDWECAIEFGLTPFLEIAQARKVDSEPIVGVEQLANVDSHEQISSCPA